VLALALCAALAVAAIRLHYEGRANRVELALDYADFSAFAKSYNYRPDALLGQFHRAGLTSLAVSEELGGQINGSGHGIVTPGQALIDSARLTPIADPLLARLLRKRAISPDELYLTVYDRDDLARYREQLALHLSASAVRVLRDRPPYLLAVRTQADYFNSLGLGIPQDAIDLVRRHPGLHLIPRLQNDERFAAPQIEAEFAGFLRGGAHVSTVVFFGVRNTVLGYPAHLDDTADAFRSHPYVNFGAVEVYDRAQEQRGTDGLGSKIPLQTTRVQAIAKAELDKLDFETVIARYLLGARERNVRVIYLRPFPHLVAVRRDGKDADLSAAATNVELIGRIADGLRVRGLRLGPATPVRMPAATAPLVAVASLAVPAALLLLLIELGWYRRGWVAAAFAADVLLLALGYLTHHDLAARKLIGLTGAVLFPTAALLVIAPVFRAEPPAGTGAAIAAGFRTAARAAGTALAGALVVVGLLSAPLLMEEIDRFTGVKAVIVVPPVLALGLYLFSGRFGSAPLRFSEVGEAPVRVYQLLAIAALAAAAVVYLARSGNQSDITPSAFELALRSNLTSLLSVRPRFKEFLIGFPCMLLLPALWPAHRRRFGWLFALAIAVGTSDIVDTFSHLHTALIASALRVVNGFAVGAIAGIAALAAYRRWVPAPAERSAGAA
jgi:hypothetical protein